MANARMMPFAAYNTLVKQVVKLKINFWKKIIQKKKMELVSNGSSSNGLGSPSNSQWVMLLLATENRNLLKRSLFFYCISCSNPVCIDTTATQHFTAYHCRR